MAGKGLVDPGHQSAHLGVNSREVGLSTALTPGDNTLQLPVTHQRTTRVTLGTGQGKSGERRKVKERIGDERGRRGGVRRKVD